MKARSVGLAAALSFVAFVACGKSEQARPDPARVGTSGAAGAGSNGVAGMPGQLPVGGSSGSVGGSDGGRAGTSAAGKSGSGGAAVATTCPTDAPGPALVELKTPAGVRYCMDRTEITQAQYAVFLDEAAKNPKLKTEVAGQHPVCLNNPWELITRNPGGSEHDPAYCGAALFDPKGHPDSPVVCVGHCGARAYCQWAGKELCGAPAGGSAPMGKAADAQASAWTNACTNGGTTSTSTGITMGERRCTPIADGQGREQTSVEAEPECRGAVAPFDAVLNLGGGVAEWENACEESTCAVRGAMNVRDAAGVVAPDDACARDVSSGGPAASIGFRCCKPLAEQPLPRHPRTFSPAGWLKKRVAQFDT